MKVIAIDALLWDIFDNDVKKIGGAGSNFIYHLKHMGAQAQIISAIGKDNLGKELKAILEENHISYYLQENKFPTSTVDANVDEQGVPHWKIHENIAWDHIVYDERIDCLIKDADLIYFGSLPQRNEVTRATIRQMVKNKKPQAKTFVDINIRQHYYSQDILEFCLNHADYLKISDEEMPIISKVLNLPEDPKAFYNQVKSKVEIFIYTKGAQGCDIYKGDEVSYHKGFKITVKDTVGAGDSFSATACALALKGESLDTINHFANAVAAYICQKEGAMHSVPFTVF